MGSSMQAVEQPEAPMEVATGEVASESVPSCIRSCDGLELRVSVTSTHSSAFITRCRLTFGS